MKSVLIKHASVFDGQVFLPDHYSIYLKNNSIANIFKSSHTPPADIEIDAKGNTVLPALIDGHCHFMANAWRKYSLDLSNAMSHREAASGISAYARQLPPGEWVRGGGWSFHTLGLENMSINLLDSHSHGHPVALESKDFHSVWINTAAQKLIGLPENPRDRGDAVYGRDATGRFNGILFENARNIVYEKMPEPSSQWIFEAMKTSVPQWYRYGFTGCVGMEMEKDIAYLNNFVNQGGAPFRVSWYAPWTLLNQLIQSGIKSGDIYQGVTLGGIKLFADGAFGSLTAEMNSPYRNSTSTGVPVLPQQQMEEIVSLAHQNSLAVAVHAIGDKAIDRVIQAFQRSFSRTPQAVKLRNRIEHLQIPGKEAILKMGKWRIAAGIQPNHIPADISIIQEHLPDRTPHCYPFRRLHDHQVPLIMSSDAPVAEIDPWENIYIALTQTDPHNKNRFLNPRETISLEESLKAYTKTAAEFGYMTLAGEIKEGYKADLAILNQDLSKLKTNRQLLDTKNLYTIMDGNIVFTSEEIQ